MSATDLTTILINLQNYREILAKDIETVPPNTRPSFEIARRDAQDNIAALTKEYGDRLFATSICFAPSGPAEKTAAFVDVALAEAPTMIVADVDELYVNLAKKVWPGMGYQGQFTIDCFSTLVRELKHIAIDLDVTSIMSPKFGEPFACTPPGADDSLPPVELVEYLTKLVREVMGDGLNKLYLRQQIVEKAIAAEHTDTLPVILINATPDEADSFKELFKIFAPVAISSSTEVTPDFAISTFKKYSKRPAQTAKKQTPPTPPPPPVEDDEDETDEDDNE